MVEDVYVDKENVPVTTGANKKEAGARAGAAPTGTRGLSARRSTRRGSGDNPRDKSSGAGDSDETVAFSSIAGERGKGGSEPTIVLSSASGRSARAFGSSIAIPGMKKPGLRLPTTKGNLKGNLSKIGRAQRVQRVAVPAVNEEEDSKHEQTIEFVPQQQQQSESDNAQNSQKSKGDPKSIREKIGDISYILNWERGTTTSSNVVSDDPTISMETGANQAGQCCDGETITIKEQEQATRLSRAETGSDAGAQQTQSRQAEKTITFKKSGSTPGSRANAVSGSAQKSGTPAAHSMDETVQMQATATFHYNGGAGNANPMTPYQAGRSSINSTGSGTFSASSSSNIGSGISRQERSSSSSGSSSVAMAEVQAFHQSLMSPKNLFIVNGRPYLRLAVIGRGGSSKVFKVLAIGDAEPQIYALKRIKLQRVDEGAIASFLNEIKLMEKLRGNPNIIQLIDSHVNLDERVIYMVMEHGEIDLNSMLQQQRKLAANGATAAIGGGNLTMVGNLSINLVRLVWMNMLEAVNAIHEERIVHGDLKPANFLFVKGKLKLIDFGIAKAISNDTTNIHRDTQVGTLNYMSPEAIIDTNGAAGSRPRIGAPGMKLKQGRASDIWSMGCILYQMVYGQTPFHDLKLIQKIHCISDPKHVINYPPLARPYPDLVDAVKRCLQFFPSKRSPITGSAGKLGLLNHPFLNPPQGVGGGAAGGSPDQNVLKPLLLAVVNDVLAHSGELGRIKSNSPEKFEDVVSSLSSGFAAKLVSAAEKSRSRAASQRVQVAKIGAMTQGRPTASDNVEEDKAPDISPGLVRDHVLEPLAEGDEPDSETSEHWQQQRRREMTPKPKRQEEKPKPKPVLQDSLRQSIRSGMAGLKPVDQSSSARYMRPKGGTPEKDRGLATLMSEAMDKKREMIMTHEHTLQEMERSGHTWDFLPSFEGTDGDNK